MINCKKDSVLSFVALLAFMIIGSLFISSSCSSLREIQESLEQLERIKCINCFQIGVLKGNISDCWCCSDANLDTSYKDLCRYASPFMSCDRLNVTKNCNDQKNKLQSIYIGDYINGWNIVLIQTLGFLILASFGTAFIIYFII